jgi:predicted PurR-regulated permease PerM
VPDRPHPRVHPTVERLGAYAWWSIGIGIVALAFLHVLGLLRVVVFPLVVALFLTVALTAPARWLRRRGLPHLLSVWAVFLGFLGLFALAGFLIVPALADEFADLGPTVGEGIDDIERWLVEDSPFDLDQERLDELREQASDRISDAARGSSGVLLDTAVLVVEVFAGIILSLVMTFFFLKDGERFQAWALRRIPAEHREAARRGARRGWQTIAGYLRGSAMLGLIEGAIIGVTLLVTGASLIVPVIVLTFFAAFVPFVGAIVAGVVAVAVALATAGFTPALIVAAVALAVQQLDNDLLAPYVFGKALDLHPLIILVAVAAGGTLAGLAGAFLAVPVTACAINVTAAVRNDPEDELPPPAPGSGDEPPVTVPAPPA